MVLVTHSLQSVTRLCDRAVWLHKGVIQMDGNSEEVVKKYIEVTE